jgi:hypothetical protein
MVGCHIAIDNNLRTPVRSINFSSRQYTIKNMNKLELTGTLSGFPLEKEGEAKSATVMAKSKHKLDKSIWLPGDMVNEIAEFAGFREVFILHFLVPEVCPERYLRTYGCSSIESAIDKDRVHEVHYRLWKHPQPPFRKSILVSRAVRMARWDIIRCLTRTHNSRVWMWDITKAIHNGSDHQTIKCMMDRYPSAVKDRYRPICLYEAEQCSNIDVFLYLLIECDLQKRWRGKVKKTLENIHKRKWLVAEG